MVILTFICIKIRTTRLHFNVITAEQGIKTLRHLLISNLLYDIYYLSKVTIFWHIINANFLYVLLSQN